MAGQRREAAQGRRLRRGHGLPAAQPRGARGLRARDRARHRERGPVRCSAGATSRWTTPRLGETARRTMPVIRQVFVGAGRGSLDRDAFERKLYIIRKALGPRHPRARPRRRGRASTCRRSRTAPSSTRACCSPHQVGRVLPRPARQALRLGAVPRAPALLDEHVPDVGPRAPVPLHRAQRRDQHAAGQPQLDPLAPGDDPLEAAGRGPRQDLAADLRRPVGLGVVRQRARAAGDGRLPDRPRDDADDPGGVGGQPAHGREAPRLLRVPRGADGAVGRPRGGGVHRRQVHRRDPRPQRPAPRALLHHRRRPHRHVLGDGRARHPAGEDRRASGACSRARCCWSTSSTAASSPTRS